MTEFVRSHEEGMDLALAEARKAFALGEIPVGAVVIDEAGRVIGRGHNLCESFQQASYHAEMLALQEASRYLNNWRLTGCTMYVTLEPCAMCAGALLNARLTNLVYGAGDPRAGGCDAIFNIVHHPRLNHQINTISTVRENECKELLQLFFAEQRGKSKKIR